MNDIGELRSKRLENYKKQLNKQFKIQKQIEMLEQAVKQKLTKEAIERYGNLKAAHPQKAVQLLTMLAQFIDRYESIDDDTLKDILMNMSPEKRETKIRRV